MSMGLYWRPVLPAEDYSLPYELKVILARRYWEHDGTLGGEPVRLTSADIPYLSGLKDANIRGAAELIDGINKCGAVEIFITN